MMVTFLLSLMIMLGIFLMIWSAVVLIGQKRFFSSAPKDIQAAIIDKPQRFPGAVALGYGLVGLSVALCLGAVLLAGWDGIRRGFGLWQFFVRYGVMFYLYLGFDILLLDWFLLTRSGFYQHFYPETRGCQGYHSFGFNWKEKVITALVIPPASLVLGLIGVMLGG